MKLLVVKGKYGWSTPCSNTAKDGSKDTYWLNIQFKKDEAPAENKEWIIVKDSFLSCYAKQDGTLEPKLIIMAYEFAPVPEKTGTTKTGRTR